MQKKIHSYENEEIKITWDKYRCIHAAECVRGLPKVFNPKEKRWIKPENAAAQDLTKIVQRCPTGALHFEINNSDSVEQPPVQNSVRIAENGPVYLHGNVVIHDADGNELLRDTRVALCRCGASKNKPLCDNSHLAANFKADTSFDPERLRTEPLKGKGGELTVKVLKNAPFVVEGNYDLIGNDTGTETCSKKMSFCRCGASSTKPFCDGTHKKVNFISD
ncbi:MAG: CDGSH iron-sulfur domain-containing protein [Balneolaceae bacterium]